MGCFGGWRILFLAAFKDYNILIITFFILPLFLSTPDFYRRSIIFFIRVIIVLDILNEKRDIVSWNVGLVNRQHLLHPNARSK
jgi:hypothetical protein